MTVLEEARQIQAQTDAMIAQGQVETQELKALLANTLADIQGVAPGEVGTKPSPKLEPLTTPPAPSSFKTMLFAGILACISGLLVGIAIGTTYIAPTL